MNCFNIREIQSILKRKFFTDLINTHEHHTLLDKTAMGLRFKTNNINTTNSNIFIFYNYGIEFAPKIRSNYFINNDSFLNGVEYFNSNNLLYNFINKFLNFNFFYIFNTVYLFLFNNIYYLSIGTTLFKEPTTALIDSAVTAFEGFIAF
jgi:hypothetical protein